MIPWSICSEVLFAEFACGYNLTRLHAVAVAGVDYYFLAPDAVVLFHELALVDNLLLEEACVARVEDVDLTHHLAYDDFEVLVVDLHTLHAVYILYLIDDVLLYGCRAHDVEDVGGSCGAVGQRCAGTHVVVLLHKNLF